MSGVSGVGTSGPSLVTGREAAGDAGVRVLDLLSDAYLDGVGSYIELMRFNMRQLQEGLGDD